MKRPVIKAAVLTVLLLSFCVTAQEKGPHIITFFFVPISRAPKTLTQEKLHRRIATPGALNHSLIKKQLTQSYAVSGICVVYAGFSYFSDNNGQVMFPRYNLRPKIRVMVTNGIKPIFYPDIPIPTRTVHHWELVAPKRTAYYEIELKQINNDQTGWKARKLRVPKTGRIPDDALIIFADPQAVVIPTNLESQSSSKTHFFLPDIYVTPKISTALSALRFLKVRRYFAPLRMVYKYGPKEIRAKLDP